MVVLPGTVSSQVPSVPEVATRGVLERQRIEHRHGGARDRLPAGIDDLPRRVAMPGFERRRLGWVGREARVSCASATDRDRHQGHYREHRTIEFMGTPLSESLRIRQNPDALERAEGAGVRGRSRSERLPARLAAPIGGESPAKNPAPARSPAAACWPRLPKGAGGLTLNRRPADLDPLARVRARGASICGPARRPAARAGPTARGPRPRW